MIGCGSAGRRHIGNLLALGCQVFAFDPSLEALALVSSGAKTVRWDLCTFVPGDFAAIVIATPWDQHLDLVEMAVATDVAVFCEKPLGSLDQLPRWRELATIPLPVTTQVGYQCRFHPLAMAIYKMKPHGASMLVNCDMASWPGSAYGPPLLEMSHEIDLVLWWGAGSVSWGCLERSHQDIQFGSEWCVELEWKEPHYFREWKSYFAGSQLRAEFSSPKSLGDEMYRAEMAHFLECVREQKPTSVPLADGLRVLEVCAQVEALCPSSR